MNPFGFTMKRMVVRMRSWVRPSGSARSVVTTTGLRQAGRRMGVASQEGVAGQEGEQPRAGNWDD